MTDPYSFQPRMLNEARALMRKQVHRILLRSETGSGKTHMASEMFKGCLQRQKTADFCVHRVELILQTAKTFKKHGIPFGIIAAGQHSGEKELVQLCSVQTVIRMPERKPFMLCIDEAQHCSAASYQKLQGDFLFGLSATPCTPSGGGLGKWFTHMINGPTIPELQAIGCLSQYRYFAPSIPDLSAVGIIAGDYNPADIDRIMQGKTIVGDIVRHWQRLAAGKLTIGFAPSVAASKAYVEAFQSAGVTSAHIDGTTPKDARKAICEAFCEKRIMVLFNVGIMEEGFDIGSYGDTDVTVEALINARPTKSLRLARQINGRVLRRKSYPAIILDHAGQFTRTGMPDDIIQWSLDAPAKNMSRQGKAGVQQCAKCDAVYPPAPRCPYCSYEAPVQERKLRYTEGELIEMTRAAVAERKKAEEDEKRKLAREVNAARTLPELLEIAKQRGYNKKWAEIKFKTQRKKK